jgi:lipoyl(octanoyl) transferase
VVPNLVSPSAPGGTLERQYRGESSAVYAEIAPCEAVPRRPALGWVVTAACYRGDMDTAVRSELAPRLPGAPAPDGPASIDVHWLGRIDYHAAWALQRELVEARVAGTIDDQLLLLEHPPVLTLGRHADERFVRAEPGLLARRGIEVIRVERGGEVTYHGPGQLVAYPILGLGRRGLLVRPLVRALEGALVETCAELGVQAGARAGHPGCWVDSDGSEPRKIGALGLRVERGVCFHGIALNIDPAMADFELLDACGMPGVISTSIATELGRPDEAPSTPAVARAGSIFARALGRRLGAELVGDLPA